MTELTRELEFAVWYNANDHLDPINSCRESIKDSLNTICTKKDLTLGSINYEILKPGDDRVPSVPRWLENINHSVPRLLVATAKTIRKIHQESIGIIGDLDKKDVTRLRFITRREYQMAYPNTTNLTDYECDQIINELGMQVVMEQLGSHTVH